MIRSVVWTAAAAVSLIGADIASVFQQQGNFLAKTKITSSEIKNDANASLLGFEGTLQQKWDTHVLRASTSGHFRVSEGMTTKNRWTSELNYDYHLGERLLLNSVLGYNEAYFSGLQQKFYMGPSFGVKMVDEEKHRLELRGNILFHRDKVDELRPEEYFSSRMGALYTWDAQDNLRFTQEESCKIRLSQTDHYIFYSKSTLEKRINPWLWMGVNYKVDAFSIPDASSMYTDRTFFASLQIRY